MRTDALVRELRTEAEEAARWTVPGMDQLRRGRARQRRRRAVAGGLTTAFAAAAVVGAVVVPGAQSPERTPVAPAASPTPSPADPAHDWAATDCAPDPEDCRVPTTLMWQGRALGATSGGAVPTRHRAVRSPDLPISVKVARSEKWVLVGAVGSGPRSDLAVRFGRGPWEDVAPGRLSLLRVPDHGGRFLEVVVRERTRPLPQETLRIEIYEPR